MKRWSGVLFVAKLQERSGALRMAAGIVTDRIHRFSADDYELMATMGVIPRSGVELIDGVVTTTSPKGDRHGFVLSQLNEAFVTHPRRNYRVYCDALSLRALPDSTPDPDIALARPVRSYAHRRPEPHEIALIVQVADSSYAYDTNEKRLIYARAGIPEYWVFDVREGRADVVRFAHPVEGDYMERYPNAGRDVIAPREYPAVEIDLAVAFGLDEDAMS